LSPDKAKALRLILKFAETSVGAYMDPLAFSLYEDIKVGEAVSQIKDHHKDVLHHIPITANNQQLVGVVELKTLFITDYENPVHSIMIETPVKVLAEMDIEALLEPDAWDDAFVALPVVDVNGIFLGVLKRKVLSEIGPTKDVLAQKVGMASSALGDLYKIGLFSMVKSVNEFGDRKET
jgi:Mg/Co/Ni transporter MgtE